MSLEHRGSRGRSRSRDGEASFPRGTSPGAISRPCGFHIQRHSCTQAVSEIKKKTNVTKRLSRGGSKDTIYILPLLPGVTTNTLMR